MHHAPVFRAHFSSDSRRIITAGAEGNARIWRAEDGKECATLPHPAELLDATLTRDGRLAITASLDRTARVWDVASQKLLIETADQGDDVFMASASPMQVLCHHDPSRALARLGHAHRPPDS